MSSSLFHDCAKDSGVEFDEVWFEENKPTSSEVRKKYPRKECPTCGAIVYASHLHYLAGDW